MVFETRYDGPVAEVVVPVGDRMIRVARPADPDRLLDDPAILDLNARSDYMPYWAYLWPGAYLLAEAVARTPWPPGGEALEIGCGLGLAGLAGLAAGLRVQFSDYDEAPLAFARRSAEANGFASGSYATRLLDWTDLPAERFGLILGADVLYERRLVPLVVNLLDRMLTPDGLGLVAGPYRVATEDLAATLARHGLGAEAVPTVARTEAGAEVRGTIHRIRRC